MTLDKQINTVMDTIITKEKIKKSLQESGLKEGDWIIMHSSLRSLGYVKGGADTVVDAILDILGEAGLLMVPTFTFTNFIPFFDTEYTPSQMGLIPTSRTGIVNPHQERV